MAGVGGVKLCGWMNDRVGGCKVVVGGKWGWVGVKWGVGNARWGGGC